ncbi:MAG: MFS transporter [Vicinamibacterales bacterium]
MDRSLTPQQEATMSRIVWRTMPLVMLVYLMAVIDRANVGFAKLQMVKDLGMSETTYGFAASLFFVGYLVFEVPSALALNRFGARLWLTRILVSWGAVTVALAFTTSHTMFTVLRFLLGVAEAGAYPGIIFFTTLWFPQAYRARVMAIVTLGSAFGNMFGSLVSGPLLDLNGALGLKGWQWIFVATGVPAVLIGIAVYLFLTDEPAKATFLSADEKAWLQESLARENTAKADHGSVWQVLWDVRVLGLSLVYTLILTALYGVIYWIPTVVRAFGVTGTQNGLLSALPWMVAAVLLMIVPSRIRKHETALASMVVLSVVGVVAFLTSTMANNNALRLLGMVIGTPCISLLLPSFWTLPSRFLSGARAATGIAAISSFANLGGFASQNLMPMVAEWGGFPAAAMIVPTICLALLGAWVTVAAVKARPMQPASA